MSRRSGSPVFLSVRFWKANAWGDGGTKRSAQIDEAFTKAYPGAELRELVLPISPRRGISLRSIVHAYRLPASAFSPRVAIRAVRDAGLLKREISVLGDRLRAVIWEATPSLAPTMVARCPLLAFPHNMESFTSVRRILLGTDDIGSALKRELKILRHAHHVATISPDEAILLRNAGLPAECFPYHPPEPVGVQLEGIRRFRMGRTYGRTHFLILGSASNPVTAAALRTIVNAITQRPWQKKVIFTICGNGTEHFGDYAAKEIRVLGRVSDEALQELMRTCDAAIVYQEVGAGVLTRIREFLMAGIPVIANVHAARGYSSAPGLHVFPDLVEILDWTNVNEVVPACLANIEQEQLPNTLPVAIKEIVESGKNAHDDNGG